jgi:hypothetical protein
MLRIVAVALGVLSAIGTGDQARAREATSGDWVRYHNQRFGFRVDYPADLFHVERTSEAGDGRVFAARDGEARLLVGALRNEDEHSPKSYQDFLARDSYPEYKISYRPLGEDWLVLSGEGGGKVFYEKAMFSCKGQLISSFAMIYPAAQRDRFDPIVARVANSFVPGRAPCEASDAQPRRGPAPPRPAKAEPASPGDWQARVADRIARERGRDVIVVLRRAAPPYDYKYVRGYAPR